MSELASLIEVEGIWKRRMEQAEEALRAAQRQEQHARQVLENSKVALADYIEQLPGLIEQLYADCIGHIVSRQFVQDKSYDEGRLRARVAELRAEVVEAEKGVEAAIEAVRQAQAALNKERLKLEAMRDLIKQERVKIAVAEGRTLAKALDDLSGAKFARGLRKAS
jgi:predicted  nucleic acid-binding Zn-ribbon protein